MAIKRDYHLKIDLANASKEKQFGKIPLVLKK
jgi:hypothetical protein